MAWIEVTEVACIEGKWEDKKRFINLDHVCDIRPRDRTSQHHDRAAEYQGVINFSHHPEKWICVREDYAALVRAIRLQSLYATGSAEEERQPNHSSGP
jgi:hypothetical protein